MNVENAIDNLRKEVSLLKDRIHHLESRRFLQISDELATEMLPKILLLIDERSLQVILQKVDRRQFALASIGFQFEVLKKIKGCVSENSWKEMKEQMGTQWFTWSSIISARKWILWNFKNLEMMGEIIFAGHPFTDEIMVKYNQIFLHEIENPEKANELVKWRKETLASIG